MPAALSFQSRTRSRWRPRVTRAMNPLASASASSTRTRPGCFRTLRPIVSFDGQHTAAPSQAQDASSMSTALRPSVMSGCRWTQSGSDE